MADNLIQSTQFSINQLAVYTKSGELLDISSSFGQLHLFDSIFVPVMNGFITVFDSVGLSDYLSFDGSEVLLVDLGKFEDGTTSFKKSFRIRKMANRINLNPSTLVYDLHFVSDELIYSDQRKVNQKYNDTYSNIVAKILFDYLKLPTFAGIFSPSYGIKSIVIPDLSPIDAIQWCTNRAVDENLGPSFMFYENIVGYNFTTLSNILTQDAILDIKFFPKNLNNTEALDEMSSPRHFEVISNPDVMRRTRQGVNAGKYSVFDPITRTLGHIDEEKTVNYLDHYQTVKHGNDTPMFTGMVNRDNTNNFEQFEARRSFGFSGKAREASAYIKKKDPTSITTIDNQEDFVLQRRSIIENLISKRLKMVMPGNFELSSGFNVNVLSPVYGKPEGEDQSVNGKYLIVASRHILDIKGKFETVLETATTSTDIGFIEGASATLAKAALEYEDDYAP
jgi:hypothetical protein